MTDEIKPDFEEQFHKLEEKYSSLNNGYLALDRRLIAIERRLQPELPAPLAFDTIDDLVDGIEKLFNCTDGHHGQYAMVEPVNDPTMRYRTLGYLTRLRSGPEPFKRLRQALFADLAGIALRMNDMLSEDKPNLLWRFAKECRIEEEEYASFEGGDSLFKIRTRIVIPAFKQWDRVRSLTQDGESYKEI